MRGAAALRRPFFRFGQIFPAHHYGMDGIHVTCLGVLTIVPANPPLTAKFIGNNNEEVSAKMTFGEALKVHQQNQADDVTIKPSTRHYWNQIFVALLKSWPGLADTEIRRTTKTDCKKWARTFRKVASPTRYNNTISGLRHVFDVAKEAGVIYSNPAEHL